MNNMELDEIRLTGLALEAKTSNEGGQSMTDCGDLWQKFLEGNYQSQIPGKLSEEIYAVYYNYEGDHTMPFSYFIGCKVEDNTVVPDGMSRLNIQPGTYELVIAKGKIPDCIAKAWREIWDSSIPRAYKTDFEVYGEKSKDWNDAVVEIYLSVKK